MSSLRLNGEALRGSPRLGQGLKEEGGKRERQVRKAFTNIWWKRRCTCSGGLVIIPARDARDSKDFNPERPARWEDGPIAQLFRLGESLSPSSGVGKMKGTEERGR